jgi:hypothetical protein
MILLDIAREQYDFMGVTRSAEYSITDESGNPVISFKTLLKAEYKSGGTVVSENIEENSFATYNKTTEPREYAFDVALQAPNQDIGGILDKLEELKKGVELFTFSTPFTVYEDLTLEGYSTTFETTTNMLVVSLQCKEVIQVEQGYTSVEVKDATPVDAKPIDAGDAKNPDNASTVDTGITQTSEPTATEGEQAEESILYRAGGSII